MEQSEYDTLLAFFCDCKYPPECSKNEKDCIRRRAKNFIVKEGLLFYRDKHNKEYRVVTKKEKMKVLDGCHSAELGGGHFGRDKTLLKISERFYWIGMVNDVKEYCKTCEKCQKANRKFDKFSAELHPIPVKDEVWHTIGVDLIGPLPETQKGNKYIMTVSCPFSKWPEATALPDKTARGVAEFLFLCFTRHGCCKVKISDQGREFVNQVNDELCRLCGIQCNMTSAYHPQSNGLDERFNQTLQRQLLKFVESEQNSWDQFLDAILFSYRVSCQDSTKHSPFYLVYDRQPRLPIEFTMKCPGASERCDKPEDGLQQTIIECNIKNSKKHSKKGSKMEPNWTGPYLIHEVLSKGTYRLSKPNPPFQVLAQKYNITRLKITKKTKQKTHTPRQKYSEDGQQEDLTPLSNTHAVLEDPNGWLDDEHIAQHLLQEQHPDVAGLQSTSLQYTRTFEVLRDHPFIQCLHENGNHWITVPTVGCSSGVVQVFDSSHHLKLSHSLKCIIADMLQASKDSIVLEYIKMQEQSGASDCGLFAIATATAICNGQDLCMLEFDQFLMRKHLLQCFQNGAVLPFPSQSIAARKPKVLKEEVVEIYCHCRLPIQEERWCNAMDARSGSIAIACMYLPGDPLIGSGTADVI
ncbi:hypothetical protein EMCRGX_G024189 [Ephydatia muelleri]